MLLSFSLLGCAAAPGEKHTAVQPHEQVPVELLREQLPGTYSNLAQANAAGSDSAVTDLRIRQVKTASETVFLFASEDRRTADETYDVYWLKTNPGSKQAQLHFARLGPDELALPTQEVIRVAWQRVHPGCTITMNRIEGRISGLSNPETCVFEDSLQGRTSLVRRLDIDIEAGTMVIQNRVEDAAGRVSRDSGSLELLKHRVFTGWASVRVQAGNPTDGPGEWQLSTVFDIRDDGRIHHLRTQDNTSMGFGLQLSKLYRVEGERASTRFTVINMESGMPQAYSWYPSATDTLNMNLDWFQANLELRQPVENQDP